MQLSQVPLLLGLANYWRRKGCFQSSYKKDGFKVYQLSLLKENHSVVENVLLVDFHCASPYISTNGQEKKK